MLILTLERTTEYQAAKAQYMEQHNIFKFALLNEKQRQDVYAVVLKDREQVSARVLGRIGNGNKVHKLNVRYVALHNDKGEDVAVLTSAFSHCGSQKWTSGFYRSALSMFALLTDANKNQITCERCSH